MKKSDLKMIERFISLLTVKGKKDENGRNNISECKCNGDLLFKLFEVLLKNGKEEEATEFLKLATTELDRFADYMANSRIAEKLSSLEIPEPYSLPVLLYILENNSSRIACDSAAKSMVKVSRHFAECNLFRFLQHKDGWRRDAAKMAIRILKKEMKEIRERPIMFVHSPDPL